MEQIELKKIDTRRSELYVDSVCNYYDLMKRTEDTIDYVPEKYNKKIAKLFFKEFKECIRQSKRNYKEVLAEERSVDKSAKRKVFIDKLKAKFKRKLKPTSHGITPELLAQMQALMKSPMPNNSVQSDTEKV